MSPPMVRRSWRDWVLFGAAYGVILGAILFAYPPSQGTARPASTVSHGMAAR
ncbi:hypothetical protein [Azorhizobium sp. AG788]|uniref:hypothetical protein n=1 Tax=Azorhizobium sp. AG788 TaxID=2183897 RepID=UPI0031394094